MAATSPVPPTLVADPVPQHDEPEPRPRTAWLVIPLLLIPLVLVMALGMLAWWGARSFLAPSQAASPANAPQQLGRIPLPSPNGPSSLVWSADGHYLAGGTWGRATGETAPGEVYVIDVAQASLVTTLKTKSWVEGLAFSPDRKWLAVATRPSIPAGTTPELIVFDVPAFAPQFTAKAGGTETGFVDLAWSPNSQSLHAIEGPVDNAQGKAKLRRWDMPAFAEQPENRAPQFDRSVALAASPDGGALAVAEQGAAKTSLVIRVFDLDKGAEPLTFTINDRYQAPRLAFSADGKAVGVFDTQRISWWSRETGRAAEPGTHRFAIQPAGLCQFRSTDSISSDGGWQARGHERHRGLGDLGWDNRDKEFGSFVTLTETATAKSRTWRVSSSQNTPPAVAFSADGMKLAGAVTQPSGAVILIWAVPQ